MLCAGLECPICSERSSIINLSSYLRHIRLLHADRPNFQIKCNLEDCQKKPFRSFCYFRNHVYDCHGSLQQQSSSVPLQATSPRHTNYPDDPDQDSYPNPDSETDDNERESCFKDMEKAAAIWILKTRECNKLTQTATENIIKDVDSLYQVALHNIHCAVEDELRKAGIDPSVLPGLSHIFNTQGPHGRLFAGLESQHKQMKYLKSQFNLVVSCKEWCIFSHTHL